MAGGSTAQHSTAQHSTAQHSTAQHSIAGRMFVNGSLCVAGHTRAYSKLPLEGMSCTATQPPALPPQDDLPAPTLKDFPALALHAVVNAVRRPASLLLPATATLFCARCVARVAEIALRLAESEHLNAWAGAYFRS